MNVIGLTLPRCASGGGLSSIGKIFLSRHAKEAKRPGMWFTCCPGRLVPLFWPGNIRELDNVIARAVILSQTDLIEPEVLALDFNSPVIKEGCRPVSQDALPRIDGRTQPAYH